MKNMIKHIAVSTANAPKAKPSFSGFFHAMKTAMTRKRNDKNSILSPLSH
ncbi:hypothetical protein CSUNSWCD_65 [Campylobacter showae CSUNSWCD]|uniref:Uncharacterized protein n=1 Tax=Campylobacter showae CSUNSWCD TaxID=1244083 RepID=M5ILP3_9BACT|nr:hypothetical protein CSUNSWCD_65 [Campylobacter showae CSUNSWCD]